VSILAIALAAALGAHPAHRHRLAMSVSPRHGDLLEARLAQFAESRPCAATLAEVEMSLPLFDRVVRPFLDKVGNRLNRNAARAAPTHSRRS